MSMLSGLLSTALALTGAGIPMVMAAQLAGSLVTGHMGKKKAETAIGNVKGLEGTKFGEEVKTYKDEIGSDILQRALMDTAITGLTMGVGGGGATMGKGVQSAGKSMGKMLSKLGLKDWVKEVAPNISKFFKTATPLAGKTGKIADLLGAVDDSKIFDRMLSATSTELAKEKQKNIFQYDVPASLGKPSGYGGYY